MEQTSKRVSGYKIRIQHVLYSLCLVTFLLTTFSSVQGSTVYFSAMQCYAVFPPGSISKRVLTFVTLRGRKKSKLACETQHARGFGEILNSRCPHIDSSGFWH